MSCHMSDARLRFYLHESRHRQTPNNNRAETRLSGLPSGGTTSSDTGICRKQNKRFDYSEMLTETSAGNKNKNLSAVFTVLEKISCIMD